MIDRRRTDGTTRATHFVTIIGVPVILALLGWVALQFDAMRFDVADLKKDMSDVKNGVKNHTEQLDTIWNALRQHGIL